MKYIKQYEEVDWDKINPVKIAKKYQLNSKYKEISALIPNIKSDTIATANLSTTKNPIKKDNILFGIYGGFKLDKFPEIKEISKDVSGLRFSMNFEIKKEVTATEISIVFDYNGKYHKHICGEYRSPLGNVFINNYDNKYWFGIKISLNSIIKPNLFDKEVKSIISEEEKSFDNYLIECLRMLEDRKNKLEAYTKQQEEEKKKEDEFSLDKNDIIECFGSLIDISEDHNVNSNRYKITLECNIPGIKVYKKEKSEYVSGRSFGKTVYLNFDEAHLNVNEKLIEVLSAIIEAKSQLKSINTELKIDTILKDDRIIIDILLR